MRKKKCPYCGKSASYISRFSSRRKGEFICPKCGKESKVIIDKKIYIIFAAAITISIAIMVGWTVMEMTSNPLGIVLVAVPLMIFGFATPNFVFYEPLKKYKKSMEAKKAGIVYSDNLSSTAFLDSENSFSMQGQTAEASDGFQINSDIFNKIKKERNAARQQLQKQELISDSSKIYTKGDGVSVISDISEEHTSSTDVPLKKIHNDSRRNFSKSRHYIQEAMPEPEDNEQEIKKADTNKYSANRKF